MRIRSVRSPREADAVLAGLRLDHLVAGRRQHVAHQLEVLGVVLDDEDALPAPRRHS